MKTLTFIISLFMLPFLGTTSSTFPTSSISGIWKSDCGTLTLIIEGDRRGLRVRNHRYGNWAYYDQARGRRNTFIGSRSRSLQIRNAREILFKDRSRRASLVLRKSSYRRGFDTSRNGYYDKSRYGNNRFNNNRNRLSDRYGNSNYRGNGLDNYDAKKLRRSIDDKWENREFRVKIKIKDTDSGIKMRRDGTRSYIHYLQDYRNPTIFSDSRGNSIQILSKYEIVWYDQRNGRSLYFVRD